MSLVERVGSAFSALVTDRKSGQQPQIEPSTSGRPDNVGILALEVYFPRLKVQCLAMACCIPRCTVCGKVIEAVH